MSAPAPKSARPNCASQIASRGDQRALCQTGLGLTAPLFLDCLRGADLLAPLRPIGNLVPLRGRQLRQGIELLRGVEVPASLATSGIASPRAASRRTVRSLLPCFSAASTVIQK